MSSSGWNEPEKPPGYRFWASPANEPELSDDERRLDPVARGWVEQANHLVHQHRGVRWTYNLFLGFLVILGVPFWGILVVALVAGILAIAHTLLPAWFVLVPGYLGLLAVGFYGERRQKARRLKGGPRTVF